MTNLQPRSFDRLPNGETDPFFAVAMRHTNGDARLAWQVTKVYKRALDRLVEHDDKTVPIEAFELSSRAIMEEARIQIADAYLSLPHISEAIGERALFLSQV